MTEKNVESKTENKNLIKDALLVEVAYQNNGQRAVLTFIDEDKGEALEVRNLNKQNYDNDKHEWNDDPKKADDIEKLAQQYFKTDFDHIGDCVDKRYNIYKYDNFNSMWESNVTNKFTMDDVDDFFTTKIEKIYQDELAIHIGFEHDGKYYESKMNHNKYVSSINKYFPNPQQRTKALERFQKTFKVPFSKNDSLIGKDITVVIKSFGGHAFAEVMKFK